MATTLPVGDGPVFTPGGALPPFFSGLLPEGRRLSAIRRDAKTSADDELTLLLAVGQDAIGDVQVLPEEDTVQVVPVFKPDLTSVAFAELYAELIADPRRDRSAIAGAQDKISGGMISLPVARQGAAWILKLDPPGHPHLVANEAFFLEAAAASRLTVPAHVVVHDRDGQPGLLVKRFDRVPIDGTLQARAQEDACQVLGRYPADKYLMSTEQVIEGLIRVTAAPLVAARNLVAQFAFAYLSCNGDAHAKNFSVLRHQGEWRIAPAYDLPSTHPYGDHTMALSLGGKRGGDITARDFVDLGQRFGVPEKATRRVLTDLLEAMPEWSGRLAKLPFDPRKTHKLRKACEYRADRLTELP